MDIWAFVAAVFWAVCPAIGAECELTLPQARVTEYAPELGGINCADPCHLTGYMEPIEYGETAACGLNVPYGTMVTVDFFGRHLQRSCLDHGGAIDDDELDIAVRADHPPTFYGYFTVTWHWKGKHDEFEIVGQGDAGR